MLKTKYSFLKINIYLGPYCTENGFSKWLMEFGLRRMNTIESKNCMVLVIRRKLARLMISFEILVQVP